MPPATYLLSFQYSWKLFLLSLFNLKEISCMFNSSLSEAILVKPFICPLKTAASQQHSYQFDSSEKRLKISWIHIRKILTSSRSKSTISLSAWKHLIFIIEKETKFQPCFQKPHQSSRPFRTLGFPPLHKLWLCSQGVHPVKLQIVIGKFLSKCPPENSSCC